MSDYHQRRYALIEAIDLELSHLDPDHLRRVLQYCRTLAAEQKPLFDDSRKCVVCGRLLFKPQRGPWPKFCSNRCRQKHHRETTGRE